MRSTTPSSETPAEITAPTKPLAFQAKQGTSLGAILFVVAAVHALVIALLLSHFGWFSGSGPEADPDASAGQSGIVIPVTLETAERPEKVVSPAPEPEPQLLPEPKPEPEPESETETKPEPKTKPEPEIKPEPEPETKPESETPAAKSSAETKTETQPTPAKSPAPAAPESPLQPSTKRGGTSISSNTNSSSSTTDNESRLSTQGAQRHSEPIALPLTPAQVDPNYLHRPNPVYPALSKRLREEGTVVLRVNLDAQGVVQDIAIEKSSDAQRLDQAALEAVRQWRFIPAKRGQQAVPSTALVPIEFKHR